MLLVNLNLQDKLVRITRNATAHAGAFMNAVLLPVCCKHGNVGATLAMSG